MSTARARTAIILAAIACMLCGSRGARADVIDPAGDFLAGYVGPKNGDLDVLSTDVTFDGHQFVFTATLDGAIGTTPDGQYVWGMDRGAGTARFLAPLGLDGILFDSVVVLTTTGGSVRDLIAGTQTLTIAASDITISGDMISAAVPLSALVTQGFNPFDYTFSLWPRLVGGPPTNIADFAPNNSNARVRAVPEPTSLAMLGLGGFAVFAGLIRKRRVVS